MVLDRDAGEGLGPGPLGGEVAGVQIVCDGLRLQAGEALEVEVRLGEGVQGACVRQVAGVGAEMDPGAGREREGVLELRADRDERNRGGPGQRHRGGSEAACPAHGDHGPAHSLHHRVVVPCADRPVVDQETVRDAIQLEPGLRVVRRDRLVGDVAAGDDEGTRQVVEQEVVQARGGEQQPDPGRAGVDGAGDGGGNAGMEQHHGTDGRVEEPPLRLPRRGQLPCCPDVLGHHGERLGRAAFTAAQLGHAGMLGRVAHELVAAEALDGDDAAPADRRDRRSQRRLCHLPVPGELRPAGVTGERLRVKAPVGRVTVFIGAGGTEPEVAHRGSGPVVGEVFDHRGARPAVGAVDERIAVAAVTWVEQFLEAAGAGRGVGRDLARRRAVQAGGTGADGESGARGGRVRGGRGEQHLPHAGEHGRIGAEPSAEPRHRVRAPGHGSLDVSTGVGHPSVQAEPGGEPVHVGSETDALDGAEDGEPEC